MLSPSVIINRKKSEKNLSQSEINYIVNGYTSGNISNNEMEDWLITIFDKGMNASASSSFILPVVNASAIVCSR